MKSKSLNAHALLFGMATLPILTACASLSQMTDLGIPAPTPKPIIARPAACLEFAIIHANRGKPDVSVVDVQGALTQPSPLNAARKFLGDTGGTLAQIDEHNATWHALCDAQR